METKSFFANYVAQPVVENRFGMIALGSHTVKVFDMKVMMASENCRLDDNCKIVDITRKPNFQMEFDQEILLIVFRDSEGRVIMDRRSSIGWLAENDKDDKKALMVTPELVQQYGMSLLNGKYIKKRKGWKAGSAESEYVGIPNSFKTKKTQQILDKFCDACEVTNPMLALGKECDINVEADEYDGKDGREVKAYAKKGVGFKAKVIGATNANAPANNPAIANLPEDNTPDDLPF